MTALRALWNEGELVKIDCHQYGVPYYTSATGHGND